jgi:hypothetical protein
MSGARNRSTASCFATMTSTATKTAAPMEHMKVAGVVGLVLTLSRTVSRRGGTNLGGDDGGDKRLVLKHQFSFGQNPRLALAQSISLHPCEFLEWPLFMHRLGHILSARSLSQQVLEQRRRVSYVFRGKIGRVLQGKTPGILLVHDLPALWVCSCAIHFSSEGTVGATGGKTLPGVQLKQP